jgi:hypothetical protein
MLHQSQNARRNQVAGRITAGVHQQDEKQVELEVGQALTVNFGLE